MTNDTTKRPVQVLPVRVLLVCLGNICRSPTAEGVLRARAAERGMADLVEIDSCGTAAYHEGEPPDRRAVAAAKSRGVDLSSLRARQVRDADFEAFDRIFAMDESNLADLRARCPAAHQPKLALWLSLTPAAPVREVPDPYYGGDRGFEDVLDLVEAASDALLDQVALAAGDETRR